MLVLRDATRFYLGCEPTEASSGKLSRDGNFPRLRHVTLQDTLRAPRRLGDAAVGQRPRDDVSLPVLDPFTMVSRFKKKKKGPEEDLC